jgi:hypothetical protein
VSPSWQFDQLERLRPGVGPFPRQSFNNGLFGDRLQEIGGPLAFAGNVHRVRSGCFDVSAAVPIGGTSGARLAAAAWVTGIVPMTSFADGSSSPS